jgi:restriction system protein
MVVLWIILMVIQRGVNRKRKKVFLGRCRNVQGVIQEFKEHPTDFEHFIGDLFEKQGFQCTVTQASRDGGIDVYADYKKLKYGIECKLYSGTSIGRPIIQKIYAACETSKPKRIPVVVTTSNFTRDAIDFGERNGVWLVSGVELEKMIRRYGN